MIQLSLFGEPAEPATPLAEVCEPPLAPAPESDDDLSTRFERHLRRPLLSLVLTDNRSRIVSARLEGRGLRVRMHRCFATAPEPMLAHVAAIAERKNGSPVRREALVSVRDYFDRHAKTSATSASLDPRGASVDLREIRDQLDRELFGGKLDVDITWGRRPAYRRRRAAGSIQLGSYDQRSRLVRIHRALDRPGVPRYVVAAVVFHEMLHAAIPPEPRGLRRLVHPPAFRRRERAFPDHARAERWIRKNLGQLLRRSCR